MCVFHTHCEHSLNSCSLVRACVRACARSLTRASHLDFLSHLLKVVGEDGELNMFVRKGRRQGAITLLPLRYFHPPLFLLHPPTPSLPPPRCSSPALKT